MQKGMADYVRGMLRGKFGPHRDVELIEYPFGPADRSWAESRYAVAWEAGSTLSQRMIGYVASLCEVQALYYQVEARGGELRVVLYSAETFGADSVPNFGKVAGCTTGG